MNSIKIKYLRDGEDFKGIEVTCDDEEAKGIVVRVLFDASTPWSRS